jgi:hypothetical protein
MLIIERAMSVLAGENPGKYAPGLSLPVGRLLHNTVESPDKREFFRRTSRYFGWEEFARLWENPELPQDLRLALLEKGDKMRERLVIDIHDGNDAPEVRYMRRKLEVLGHESMIMELRELNMPLFAANGGFVGNIYTMMSWQYGFTNGYCSALAAERECLVATGAGTLDLLERGGKITASQLSGVNGGGWSNVALKVVGNEIQLWNRGYYQLGGADQSLVGYLEQLSRR